MMKQLIRFLPALFFLSCNNAADNAKSNGGNQTDSNSISKEKPVSELKTAAGCARMIFFQEGAEIVTTSYNSEGKESSKQTTKILNVKLEDGMTVAEVEGSDIMISGEPKTVHYNYKCDGNNIYFDIASMFRTAEKNGDASFESSLISYPINVSEGESLPDVTGTMKSARNGKKMEMKYHYKERKVEGKEDVTTPAGTWNCYKISNITEVEMDIPGMDEKAKKMMETMKSSMRNKTITWFSPDLGIIKMEMYLNDKLQSRNEITAIKK